MKDREPNPLPGIRREIEEVSGFSLNLRVGEMHQQEIKLIRDDVRPGASVPTSPLQPACGTQCEGGRVPSEVPVCL